MEWLGYAPRVSWKQGIAEHAVFYIGFRGRNMVEVFTRNMLTSEPAFRYPEVHFPSANFRIARHATAWRALAAVRAQTERRLRDGGRSAHDATATAVIRIGYAIVLALIKPEANSEATAPVKSKNAPA